MVKAILDARKTTTRRSRRGRRTPGKVGDVALQIERHPYMSWRRARSRATAAGGKPQHLAVEAQGLFQRPRRGGEPPARATRSGPPHNP